MRQFVLDRAGQPRAGGTALGYERKSVAVPYGNCEEPTNVKAGGQACPIRFQCAGCPSYSPDPSYLPAIQDELIRLKGSREIATVSGVAGYIVDGMDGQIRDYTNIVATMRTALAALPEAERREVEDAARLLRKSRAGSASAVAVAETDSSGRRLLPLTVVRRDPTGAGQ
ncbi:hypothetical protein J7F03_36920 [Streptomyces sp. ISL-43]|uniref:hypothetical protein n=1 Tax=Streptomyces sp. ISL-43 TaxID=2819183 RepID=UPI001BEBEFAB|nr:hypothetical protein [Streptomyces sp. ISL-43]MBT2452540.1 hypothetical protein [Streptomyces sp. ISL-43]